MTFVLIRASLCLHFKFCFREGNVLLETYHSPQIPLQGCQLPSFLTGLSLVTSTGSYEIYLSKAKGDVGQDYPENQYSAYIQLKKKSSHYYFLI